MASIIQCWLKKDDMANVKYLSNPTRRISDEFEIPAEEHIHVIIQRPKSAFEVVLISGLSTSLAKNISGCHFNRYFKTLGFVLDFKDPVTFRQAFSTAHENLNLNEKQKAIDRCYRNSAQIPLSSMNLTVEQMASITQCWLKNNDMVNVKYLINPASRISEEFEMPAEGSIHVTIQRPKSGNVHTLGVTSLRPFVPIYVYSSSTSRWHVAGRRSKSRLWRIKRSTSFATFKYHSNNHNVGKVFHDFQVAGAKSVNDGNVSVTLDNMSVFLALNYILTTDDLQRTPDESRLRALGSIQPEVLKEIHESIVWKSWRLEESTKALCATLDQQLNLGEAIMFNTNDPKLNQVVTLYQVVFQCTPTSSEMGRGYLLPQVLDALFTYQFPVRSSKHVVNWANGEAHGSKNVEGMAISPMPPLAIESTHTAKEYLNDHWNLSNFAKDAIDLFLEEGVPIRKLAAIQVFDHRVRLYTMKYTYGIYHWSMSCVASIPRDQGDSGMASCIRLMHTLERAYWHNLHGLKPHVFTCALTGKEVVHRNSFNNYHWKCAQRKHKLSSMSRRCTRSPLEDAFAKAKTKDGNVSKLWEREAVFLDASSPALKS
ncbi:MAG: hypothetical protein J3Q66DRAFT_422687 [Benniella sp.]|nr:MAG: hypothetical protein J3Q66DRAFT_422687 [Benniella sp.]